MNNWSKGNAWYHAKDFKGAYVYYKKALQEDPSNPKILKKIGDTLYNLERYQEAINYYDKTIKILPTEANKVKPNVSSWANKGNALFNLQEYEKAIFCYKKALEEKLSNSHVHSEIIENSGDALVNLERYEEAINDYYDRAIKIMSNTEAIRQKRSWAYILLGNKHRNNKKYLDAVNCYDEAIKFKPSANLWLKKGNAWFSNAQGGSKFITSDCDQAKDCYMKALKIEPNFYKALIKLGDVSLFLQEADNAVDYYRCVPQIYLSPYDEENYKKALLLKTDQEIKYKITDLIAKGNNEYNDGNLSSAKKYYDELLKHDHSKFPFGENEVKVMKGLIKYCNTTKEYEQAIIYAEKVRDLRLRDLRSDDIDNLYQRVKAYILSGNTLISQQKYVDAINRYNKALAVKPDNGLILQIKLYAGYRLLLFSIDKQNENNTAVLRIARDMIQIINRFETNIPPINIKEFANDPDIAHCRLVDDLDMDEIKSLAEDFISRKCDLSERSSKSELSVKRIAVKTIATSSSPNLPYFPSSNSQATMKKLLHMPLLRSFEMSDAEYENQKRKREVLDEEASGQNTSTNNKKPKHIFPLLASQSKASGYSKTLKDFPAPEDIAKIITIEKWENNIAPNTDQTDVRKEAKRKQKNKTPEQKKAKKEKNKLNGRWGEELSYHKLKLEYKNKYKNYNQISENEKEIPAAEGVINKQYTLKCQEPVTKEPITIEITWHNYGEESYKPKDITIKETIGNQKTGKNIVEVKTTASASFSDAKFSTGEIEKMQKYGNHYRIFRVYNAKNKIAPSIKELQDPYQEIFNNVLPDLIITGLIVKI